MLELDTITIKGFKSIASIEKLKLRPINVVIGANGSGKSNFMGVFSFLREIREGRLQDYVVKAGGAEKVLHFGSKVTPKLQVCLFCVDEVGYDVTIEPTAGDQLNITHSTFQYFDDSESGLPPSRDESNPGDHTIRKVAEESQKHFDHLRLYHFLDTSASSPMKKTADVDDNRSLRQDGSNIAAFLHLLREKHEESYNLIRRTVQLVAPFFDDFLLEPQRLNPDKIRLEWRHKSSETYFDASSFSDGTLRFIALATLFLQPGDYRPPVILVDEPELGLHPYAITLLASLIKQASAKTQVIASTQSSLLLDHFQPEDVLVAERVAGGTHLRRLDSKNLEIWLKDYSLGQLWEKNEIGGRPVKE